MGHRSEAGRRYKMKTPPWWAGSMTWKSLREEFAAVFPDPGGRS